MHTNQSARPLRPLIPVFLLVVVSLFVYCYDQYQATERQRAEWCTKEAQRCWEVQRQIVLRDEQAARVSQVLGVSQGRLTRGTFDALSWHMDSSRPPLDSAQVVKMVGPRFSVEMPSPTKLSSDLEKSPEFAITATYQWKNDDGATLCVFFHNGMMAGVVGPSTP